MPLLPAHAGREVLPPGQGRARYRADCRAVGTLANREDEPQPVDVDPEDAVGWAGERRITAEQLELRPMPLGEPPGTGMKLPDIASLSRPVEPACDQRPGAIGGDVPEQAGDLRDARW